MENLYKNFIKLNIMSNLNFENIVGFKAVDKYGNEQNVTVDEMVDMVSTRMVMALSETSTFAAAAATGNDVYENELPTVTDAANVRVLQSSGDAAKMTMQSLASKLGELIGVATSEKDGLMPSIQRMTTSYQKDQQKYCKIAEFRNRLTGISMLISVFKNHENSSPSVVLLTGYSDDLSVNSIKRGIYLTNVYYQKIENKTIVYVKSSAYVYISTLCIGMKGSLKLSHENNLDLPSDAIEIPIS